MATLPNEEDDTGADIDLYYLPSLSLQSQMMPNSDDPLLSSSPKDFVHRHQLQKFIFEQSVANPTAPNPNAPAEDAVSLKSFFRYLSSSYIWIPNGPYKQDWYKNNKCLPVCNFGILSIAYNSLRRGLKYLLKIPFFILNYLNVAGFLIFKTVFLGSSAKLPYVWKNVIKMNGICVW